jgi:predicted ATPase
VAGHASRPRALRQVRSSSSHHVAWLRSGRAAQGAAQLGRAIERLKQTGHRIWIWYLGAVKAEGLAPTGDLEQAWTLMEDSVARIEESEERSHYAEVLRLRGLLLIKKNELEMAEATLRKAIDAACGQQAKSWGLRAATTLARLLADQGRRSEAVGLLKPVHDWFTEGRQTKDLQESLRLLDELAPAVA